MAPEGRDTRPTLDRVREAMFNSLVSLDVVAYRCPDCNERFDIVLGDPDDLDDNDAF